MVETGRWNGHVFTVSPKLIQTFNGLSIKGASETEDKESGGQKYVARKAGRPKEISFTVELNAMLGSNVREEAMKLVDEAVAGTRNYFYVGGKKLVTCQLMLVEASVDEVDIGPGNQWVKARVKLTMKQASKNDGSMGGSSGGSNSSSKGSSSSSSKKSSKKASVKKTSSKGIVGAVVGAVTGAVSGIKNAVKKVTSTVKTSANSFFKKAVSQAKSVAKSAAKSSAKTKKKTVTRKVTPKRNTFRMMKK